MMGTARPEGGRGRRRTKGKPNWGWGGKNLEGRGKYKHSQGTPFRRRGLRSLAAAAAA